MAPRKAGELAASGRILDESERPVAGARVRLVTAAQPGGAPPPERTLPLQAEADAQGRFHLALPAAGTWDLRVEASGFAPTAVRGLLLRPVRGAVDLGTVVLRSEAAVDGEILGSAGDPVEGARIQMMSEGLLDARLAAAGTGGGAEILSGPDGRFSIPGLLPGTVLDLRISCEGYLPEILRDVQVPVPEPIRVVLSPASRIAGRVVDESGEPVPYAQVMVTRDTERPASGGNAASQPTGEDGDFLVEGLAPGAVLLTAVAPGYLPAERQKIEVAPGKDVDGLKLVLQPGAVLEGTVRTTGGRPVSGARVWSEGGEPAAGEPPLFTLLSLSEATTGKDGAYRLEGLRGGPRTVRVEHSDHPAATATLEVQPGTNHLDLQLEDGVEVAGRVVDAQRRPVPGAAVRLVGPEVREATAGADGGFRLAGVPDGVYRLEGERAGYAAARGAGEVRIAGGPVRGLELRLERGATVAGRISGLAFEDLSRVRIWAASPTGGQAGSVDYQGSYRIENLSPGEWLVEAHLPGGRRALRELRIEPGQTEAALDLEF